MRYGVVVEELAVEVMAQLPDDRARLEADRVQPRLAVVTARVYNWAAAKLPANLVFDPDPPTHHRWVMARRHLSDPEEVAYYLAYAPVGVEIAELAQVAGSRWAIRSASRPRRTSAAWTSTRSAAISAGISTSPWRCSPTRS